MPIRTPSPLFPGARVALAAPSSGVSVEQLRGAVDGMRALGLEAVVFPSSLPDYRHGYLAADDAKRAADLNRAFADPSVEGVWCIRGGYGAARLLPLLDWRCIAAHPKWLGGFSDITALHICLNQFCQLMTYHIPMPSTIVHKGLDPYTRRQILNCMAGLEEGAIENPPDIPFLPLVSGQAEGELTGGNLTLVASSLGTPYEIDTRGKILFLEDVKEQPYQIDRMLVQLRNAGKFKDCAGILLGEWTDCDPANPESSLPLGRIFQDLLVPEGKPILENLVCGHCMPSLCLPLGAQVFVDAEKGRISFPGK